MMYSMQDSDGITMFTVRLSRMKSVIIIILTLSYMQISFALPGLSFTEKGVDKSGLLCNNETTTSEIVNQVKALKVFDCGQYKKDGPFCNCVSKIKIDEKEKNKQIKIVEDNIKSNIAGRINHQNNFIAKKMTKLAILNEMNAGLKSPIESCLKKDHKQGESAISQRILTEDKKFAALYKRKSKNKEERNLIQFLAKKSIEDFKGMSSEKVQDELSFNKHVSYLITKFSGYLRDAKKENQFKSTLLNRDKDNTIDSNERKAQIKTIVHNEYYSDIIVQTIKNLAQNNKLNSITDETLSHALDTQSQLHLKKKCDEFSKESFKPLVVQEAYVDFFDDSSFLSDDENFYKANDFYIENILTKKVLSNDNTLIDEILYSAEREQIGDFGGFDDYEEETVSSIESAFYRDLYYCSAKDKYNSFIESAPSVALKDKDKYQQSIQNHFNLTKLQQEDEVIYTNTRIELEKINQLLLVNGADKEELLKEREKLSYELYAVTRRLAENKQYIENEYKNLANIVGEKQAKYTLAFLSSVDSTLNSSHIAAIKNPYDTGQSNIDGYQAHLKSDSDDIAKVAQNAIFSSLDQKTQSAIMTQRGTTLSSFVTKSDEAIAKSETAYTDRILTDESPNIANEVKAPLPISKLETRPLISNAPSSTIEEKSPGILSKVAGSIKGRNLDASSYQQLRDEFQNSSSISSNVSPQSLMSAESSITQQMNKAIGTEQKQKLLSKLTSDVDEKETRYKAMRAREENRLKSAKDDNNALAKDIEALRKSIESGDKSSTDEVNDESPAAVSQTQKVNQLAPAQKVLFKQPAQVVQSSQSNSGLQAVNRTLPENQTNNSVKRTRSIASADRTAVKSGQKTSSIRNLSSMSDTNSGTSNQQKVELMSLALQEGALVLTMEEFTEISTADLKAKFPGKEYPDHIIVESQNGKVMMKPIYKEGVLIKFEVEQKIANQDYINGMDKIEEEIKEQKEALARYKELLGSIE